MGRFVSIGGVFFSARRPGNHSGSTLASHSSLTTYEAGIGSWQRNRKQERALSQGREVRIQQPSNRSLHNVDVRRSCHQSARDISRLFLRKLRKQPPSSSIIVGACGRDAPKLANVLAPPEYDRQSTWLAGNQPLKPATSPKGPVTASKRVFTTDARINADICIGWPAAGAVPLRCRVLSVIMLFEPGWRRPK
jgi:hypothetical protein